MSEENNKFLISETIVIRRKNPENGLGIYYIVAKTVDNLLYELNQESHTIDQAIMWSEMLEGTIMVSNNWTSLVKVM